jgi:predicted nucleotidyltransferase
MVAMKDIRNLSRRIARQFRPRRIVLFGSYAEGQAGPDSDVDLLVVLPHKGDAVEKSVEIRLATRPPFPLDLLVRTPQEVRRRLAMGDTFMRDIVEKGKVLYETDDA